MKSSVVKRSETSRKRTRRYRRNGVGQVLWANSQLSFTRAYQDAGETDLIVSEKAEWPARVLSPSYTKKRRRPDLLVLQPLRSDFRMAFDAVFRRIVDGSAVGILPKGQLKAVLSAAHRKNLIIGASYVEKGDVLLLVRGDLSHLLVPLSSFRKRPAGPVPDPEDLSIEDYGQTVRLGQYEASTDAILYEHDPDYRKAARKNLINSDDSLGGSIRRLRLQRGLKQADFPGLLPRTIGRIERGEVETPQPATLQRIASHLGVTVDELSTY